MLRTVSAILLVLLGGGSVWAGSFSLDFNNESAQFGYLHELNREAYGESIASARLLYNDHKDTWLGTVGFGAQGSPGNIPGLKTAVEIAVNGSDTNSDNMLAIGVGLQVDYAPPSLSGFGITTGIQYAPKIFTFIDAEYMFETGVGIRYAIMPTAAITLSYQNILIDFEDHGRERVDDSVRIGIRLDF